MTGWKSQAHGGLVEVPCYYYRGGTSKGPVFNADDLPPNVSERNRFLLAALDSPHYRQIDGIGGPESLSNKVVLVSRSDRPGIDIEYRFIQLYPGSSVVDDRGTCGNMSSVVGPFALETGLVQSDGDDVQVSIYAPNTDDYMTALVQTPNKVLTYSGSTRISGVEGTGAPVVMTYLNTTGRRTGKYLPTGRGVDTFSGVPVSIIDAGTLSMVFQAQDVGRTGYESKEALDADKQFAERIDRLRQEVGLAIGLGDVSNSARPKPIMVAPPQRGGAITARDLAPRKFLPHHCHAAMSGSGALSLAAATLTAGTTAAEIAMPAKQDGKYLVSIEHPTGFFDVVVGASTTVDGLLQPDEFSYARTCRKLFSGTLYAPVERVIKE